MAVNIPSITPAVRDPNGAIVQDVYRNGPISGTGTVVTSGTAVQVSATSQEAKVIDIINLPTNGGVIVIGGSNVSYASNIGIPIEPGFTYRLQVKDLSQIWVDAYTNSVSFAFNYFY